MDKQSRIEELLDQFITYCDAINLPQEDKINILIIINKLIEELRKEE